MTVRTMFNSSKFELDEGFIGIEPFYFIGIFRFVISLIKALFNYHGSKASDEETEVSVWYRCSNNGLKNWITRLEFEHTGVLPGRVPEPEVEAVLAVTNFESMSVKFAIWDCRSDVGSYLVVFSAAGLWKYSEMCRSWCGAEIGSSCLRAMLGQYPFVQQTSDETVLGGSVSLFVQKFHLLRSSMILIINVSRLYRNVQVDAILKNHGVDMPKFRRFRGGGRMIDEFGYKIVPSLNVIEGVLFLKPYSGCSPR
ncbi:hypothetical protein Tco_0646900 [Tanacetum coccineum]